MAQSDLDAVFIAQANEACSALAAAWNDDGFCLSDARPPVLSRDLRRPSDRLPFRSVLGIFRVSPSGRGWASAAAFFFALNGGGGLVFWVCFLGRSVNCRIKITYGALAEPDDPEPINPTAGAPRSRPQ